MADKEKAREEPKKLIEKYHKQKSEITNEEQVCQSLILPLFNKVLGWDTEDPSEFKSQYSQRGKRSDYVVFLNGISQFVIEAKALDREIKQNYQDYEQAINYARNKEKSFAILTNFKQFIVLRADTEALPLQCEVRAIDIEKAAEKEEDFNIIWNFQKELWSAEKGDALYRLKPGRKVEPVSKRLVEDMRKWRSAMLNSIKKYPKLNEFANFEAETPYIEQEIQRFIDRLIFICYCEDKELKEKELKGALEEKEGRYSGKEGFLLNQVKELFKDYRSQYDSDLFFENGYCDRFRFEDYALTGIITDLRKPSNKLPYNFADIEADVLGKAYENFIGHIITGEKRFGEKESRNKRKEDVCRVVLLAVRQHPKQMGVGALALLLKGSRSKRLMMRKLHESRFFGSLFYYTTDVIANFIKQCLQLDFLAAIDTGVSVYPAPVLVLTEAGKKLLETAAIVPLPVVKSENEKKLRLTPAVEETCRLMMQLGSVEEVARRRSIAVSTVYDYLSKGIEFGIIKVNTVLSNEVQQQIRTAVKGSEERVRDVKERLPESVGYGEIMCVLADVKRRNEKNEN